MNKTNIRKLIQYGKDLVFMKEIQSLPFSLCDPEKTILIISHEISRTGAPILASKISQQLRRNGYSTIVASMSHGQDVKMIVNECDILIKNNINLNNCDYLFRKLKQNGIHMALCNTVVTGEFTRILNKYKFTVVSLIHEMKCSTEILKAQPMVQSISKYADTIIFPGRYVQDDFLSWGYPVRGKTMILPQGNYKENKGIFVSDNHRRKLITLFDCELDSRFFIGVGSINFGKGVDLMPLIADRLIRDEKLQNTHYHFIWLGSAHAHSDYEIWLKNQIYKMGLEKRFHFLGHIEDETDYFEKLAGCDAFMLLSREDAMPTVLFESINVGLKIVAFKGSGGAEELISGDLGYLVDYMDLKKYCEALMKISKDSNKYEISTQKTRQEIELYYSFSGYVQTIEEQLNSIGGEKHI